MWPALAEHTRCVSCLWAKPLRCSPGRVHPHIHPSHWQVPINTHHRPGPELASKGVIKPSSFPQGARCQTARRNLSSEITVHQDYERKECKVQWVTRGVVSSLRKGTSGKILHELLLESHPEAKQSTDLSLLPLILTNRAVKEQCHKQGQGCKGGRQEMSAEIWKTDSRHSSGRRHGGTAARITAWQGDDNRERPTEDKEPLERAVLEQNTGASLPTPTHTVSSPYLTLQMNNSRIKQVTRDRYSVTNQS